MKKFTLVLLLAVFGTVSNVNAQLDVRFNFLGFLFNNYGIGAEYVLGEEMGVGATINYSSWTVGVLDEEWKYTGFNIAPDFRFYFNPDDDAEGGYIAGYLKFRSQKSSGLTWLVSTDTDGDGFDDTWTETDYEQSTFGIALGIYGGKKWVTNSGFFFETAFGIGKYLTSNTKYSNAAVQAEADANEDLLETNFPSLDFRLMLNLGWRFGG